MIENPTGTREGSVGGLRARFTPEAEDRRAEARGWLVEEGRRGRRVYRDPRFETRAESTHSDHELVA